jgi:hypothetical protein
LPMSVGVIFLYCMTSSILHSRECPSVPWHRWPDPQSGILDTSPSAARGQCSLPAPHNITNVCKIQSTTNSFLIEPDATSASALLLSIRLRFIVNRLHQAGRS